MALVTVKELGLNLHDIKYLTLGQIMKFKESLDSLFINFIIGQNFNMILLYYLRN